ncbi:MAG: flagellar hook-basal body complex protein FliE [Spirochaetaceae bacterium]|nr:flagellar hook-basal body complex protein FliE [Spirochaetaceae bacterium]
MELLKFNQVSGHRIMLETTDPKHFAGRINSTTGRLEKENPTFADKMFEALHGVNKLQQETNDLSLKMVTDPDSLDAHDITIAIAKSNAALAMTKAIVDKAIQAYKEILSFR